jgi:hypothetical protein
MSVQRSELAYLVFLALATIGCPARADPCAPTPEIELTEAAPRPADHWSREEKWVWARTIAGDIANFNALYCVEVALDPNQRDHKWSSHTQSRRLSERFLSDVLTNPEFAKAVPRRGVRIVGALFDDNVDLTAVRFDREIWLNKCRFEGHFFMRYARLAHLSLEGSTFLKGIDMENAEIDLHLMLSDKATFGGLVHLFGTKVGGNLLADNSTFKADLGMQSAELGINLMLRNGANFQGKVDLQGARVNGALDLSNSKFDDVIVLDSAQVYGTLWLGEPGAWPKKGAHLHGFSYDRISSDMMKWPTSRYGDWLARDHSASLQPYQQLAKVLREAGAYDKANDVLYAGRERQRSQASGLRWLWLTLLKLTIGYGIGMGYFRALIPAGVLTLAGMMVLWTGHVEARDRGWAWCFWASFDEIVPLVALDEAHGGFINANLSSWRLGYFYIHRIVAFILGSFVVAGLAGLTQGT